jgi:hypothetical protein
MERRIGWCPGGALLHNDQGVVVFSGRTGVLEATATVRADALDGAAPCPRTAVQAVCSQGGAKMLARISGTVLLFLVVFVVVSLLVGFGVVWLTGGTLRGGGDRRRLRPRGGFRDRQREYRGGAERATAAQSSRRQNRWSG